jgi:hypothetical protein
MNSIPRREPAEAAGAAAARARRRRRRVSRGSPRPTDDRPRPNNRGTQRDPQRRRKVALQVAFERQSLKPVFQLIGYRLWV